MMGHKEKIKCDGEDDVVSRVRHLLGPTAGVCRYWKTRLSKRARREVKQEIKKGGD